MQVYCTSTGTTDTYLNKAVAPDFTKAWKKATGQKYSHSPMRLTREQLKILPTILVQCHAFSRQLDPSIDKYESIPGYAGALDPSAPNDLLIAIPATSYMDFSSVTKLYTSRLYFTETTGGVLGSNTMQGHNVVFDWENGRIGFAESSCTYDKKYVPKVAEDEGFASDCEVGDPVLSTSCIDSVDRAMCKHNPTNIALLGTETWTAIVESAGNEAGVSCVDAAKDGREKRDVSEPKVNCDGNGTCQEQRPCQLTCSEAARAAGVAPAPESDHRRLGCGDSFWSTCDYGCAQTRIRSVAYSDGTCREASRITRPCHIEACARSDPCLVPFIIHAVFGFHGALVSKWSRETEEIFSLALTKAARSIDPTAQVFSEGDVNVRMALPWYPDEDDPDDGRERLLPKETEDVEPSGLKVVVEISLYNPLANFKNKTVVPAEEIQGDQAEGALSAMLRNITNLIQGRKPASQCNAEELYALAKKALALKKGVFGSNRFTATLINKMEELEKKQKDHDFLQESPFGKTYNTTMFYEKSQLISAWSIRTEIDDEINYFGPPRPLWHRVLGIMHAILMTFMVFLFLTSLWSLALSAWDHLMEHCKSGRSLISPRHRYSPVDLALDPSADEEAIMGGGDVELTIQSPSMKRRGDAQAKKRKNAFSPKSSDISDR